MPIIKVPISHKFGIISQSQRHELQERLLQEAYTKSEGSRKALSSAKKPFEVTEEFVQNYNDADGLGRESLSTLAYKMLERIKRRAGLKDGGVGSHVDLPVAWTELAQLAQCQGKLQEDCLDVLITSLDQSPLRSAHIPALFYLAETTLYWLRTEALHQPYLRTGEIKFLHMGQIAFFRLFYHHMSGHLQGQNEFKNRLYTYLDGFADSQDVYSPYPSALLCMRYINEVGRMVIGDSNQEADEIKEGDKLSSHPEAHTDTESTQTTRSHGTDGLSHLLSSRQSVVDLIFQEKVTTERSKLSYSGALSSSVHDLSPTLWHSLDTWRCLKHSLPSMSAALHSLAVCGMGLASESWVDVMCALKILGDASKKNLSVLKTFQGLAMGSKPGAVPPPSVASFSQTDYEAGVLDSPQQANQTQQDAYGKAGALSDIYEKSEEYVSSSSHSAKQTCTTHLSKAGKGKTEEISVDNDAADDRQDTCSVASSVPTYTNAVFPETPGLHGWHWEVAVTYTDTLADICLHGTTSNIQKMALVGDNRDVSLLHRISQPVCPLNSAGLLDLAYFRGLHEKSDGGADDWSWRVRYSAIQGLVKVCRSTIGDSTKDGLRTVAWNTLLKAHSLEQDTRVLEALKVGQVESSIENVASKHLAASPSSVGAKVAEGLAFLYLPALPPPITTKLPQKPKAKQVVINHSARVKKPLRTTLQEEILIANALYEPPLAYETRTGFDLNRVVEDQWRKQLQEELEEEQKEQQKEQEDKQKAEDAAEREREEARKLKLGSKYKGPAYSVIKAEPSRDSQKPS